jgi:inner membrane transporter RhtA
MEHVARVRWVRSPRALLRPSAPALGVTLTCLNFTPYEAISRLALGTVVTLQFLGPLALALASIRRRLDLVWVAAAGAGVALITGGPGGGSTLGVLLALAAAAITMASVVLSQRLATASSGLDGMAIAALAGVLWLGQRLSASEVTGIGLVTLASSGAMAARAS